MDAELRYTQLGFEVIASIDRGISVSVDELRQHIDDDDIFQFLRDKDPEIDHSLFTAEDRAAVTKFFRQLGSAADARRKYGVQENGLCLLAAYCFEGLEHSKRA
jgi:hypothetical protein